MSNSRHHDPGAAIHASTHKIQCNIRNRDGQAGEGSDTDSVRRPAAVSGVSERGPPVFGRSHRHAPLLASLAASGPASSSSAPTLVSVHTPLDTGAGSLKTSTPTSSLIPALARPVARVRIDAISWHFLLLTQQRLHLRIFPPCAMPVSALLFSPRFASPTSGGARPQFAASLSLRRAQYTPGLGTVSPRERSRKDQKRPKHLLLHDAQ